MGVFLFIALLFLPFNPLQANLNLVTPTPEYKSCIFTSQPSRTSLMFYNTCPDRLYINVCAIDAFGEKKLYQSGQSIKINGRYTIYLLDPYLQTLTWAASPSTGTMLADCTKKK